MIRENLIAERIAVDHYREPDPLFRRQGSDDAGDAGRHSGGRGRTHNDMHDLLVAHEGQADAAEELSGSRLFRPPSGYRSRQVTGLNGDAVGAQHSRSRLCYRVACLLRSGLDTPEATRALPAAPPHGESDRRRWKHRADARSARFATRSARDNPWCFLPATRPMPNAERRGSIPVRSARKINCGGKPRSNAFQHPAIRRR